MNIKYLFVINCPAGRNYRLNNLRVNEILNRRFVQLANHFNLIILKKFFLLRALQTLFFERFISAKCHLF